MYRHREQSFRILAGVWLLASVVLVNSFGGILTSYLTIPKMMPSINSLEDLAGNQELPLSMNPETNSAKFIVVSHKNSRNNLSRNQTYNNVAI